MTEYGNHPAPPTGVPGGGGVQLADQPAVNPCEPLRLRWLATQRLCKQARERQEAAEKEKARDESELKSLESRFADLGGGGEGATVDGEEFTFNDLRMLERAANAAFARYRQNPSSETARAAQDAARQGLTPEMRDQLRREQATAEARMRQLRDELVADQAEVEAATAEANRLCADATKAEEAYDECVGAHSGPPAPPPPPGGSKPGGSKPGGSKPEGSKPEGSKPEGSKPEGSKPDDPRDTHQDDPRDVQSCPPGSEVWTPCRQRFIDWQSNDATLTLTIRPDLGSVRRWLGRLGRSNESGWLPRVVQRNTPLMADPDSVEIPLETVSDGALEGMSAKSVFSDIFADRAGAKLNRDLYDIWISASLSYIHSRATCERRCEKGLWTYQFVQVDEPRSWTFERRIEVAITQDAIGKTIKAVDAAFAEVAAIAARIPALLWDAEQLTNFRDACYGGTACGGGHQIKLWSERSER